MSIDSIHRLLRFTSHLSALGNGDVHLGFVVGPHGRILHLSHYQHAVDDPTEDYVLVVQEVALGRGDEKLTAICVLKSKNNKVYNTVPT